MSLIVSFWTLAAQRRTELLDAFRPVQRSSTERRWLLFPQTKTETVYPWFDYIRANATEEAEFKYGGLAMVDLEVMLPKDVSLFSLALPESVELGEYSGASVALIDEPTARAAHARLSVVTLTATEIVRFHEADGRPLADASEAEAILAAHRQLLKWCLTVIPGRIGLLMVG